ncbi:MAG: hypothetical protein AAF658_19245, partial [Myxococcota bacterium]
IILSGHSLGGGAAKSYLTAAIDRGVFIGDDVARLVTFGSMQSLDENTVRKAEVAIGGRSDRVIYRNDPIPLLPGTISSGFGTALGAAHNMISALVGARACFTSGQYGHFDPPIHLDGENATPELIRRFFMSGLDDHSILTSYRPAIKAARRAGELPD